MVEEGGGGRRRSSPCECRSPALCIPAERSGAHRPQHSPGPRDLLYKVKVTKKKNNKKTERKQKKLLRACFFVPCFLFAVLLRRRSGGGMVYVSSESRLNCERKWSMSAL